MNKNHILGAVLLLGASLCAQTATALLTSGTAAQKRDLVIIGDGFTAADQAAFNTYVANTVMRDMFGRDVYREVMNGFNIWRVNVNSVDSGVTRVNATGAVTAARNTALDYRYSGLWDRCWMEPGPNTNTRLANILAATVPAAEYVFVVLNEAGFGGCRSGNRLAVTRGVGWDVCAHEMGHMVGNLADEYTANSGLFPNAEPTAVNATKQTIRSSIKWNDYIPSTRPVPTATSAVTDAVQDVGLFEGAVYWTQGIFRPAVSSRMRSNSPEFCPVGFQAMRDQLTGFEARSFVATTAGDFNGDGRTDAVIQDGNSLKLYLSDGSMLVISSVLTGTPIESGQQVLVGDFDGDGKDDIYLVKPGAHVRVLRSTGTAFSWIVNFVGALPGWTMSAGDRFHVGDFDGDGRKDLAVSNGTSWSMGYLMLLRSTGATLTYVTRYDGSLPGWTMSNGDRFQVGDFDGDNRDDICVWNGTNWSMTYLMLLRSTGAGLTYVARYDGSLPGWSMSNGDRVLVGDFNGDNRDDVFLFNGSNWAMPYLGMYRSTGGGLVYTMRYDGAVPGWTMRPGDRHFVADQNGDGRKDLIVFNATNWATEYLGGLRSNGAALAGGSQADWIGSWNLGAVDNFAVADWTGGGMEDLFVFNANWFGMLRSFGTSFGLSKIYPRFIRNVRYHRLGWW